MLANESMVDGVKLSAKLKSKDSDALFEQAFVDLDDNNTDQQIESL